MKEHLLLQDLSDCASSADSAPASQSTAIPLQNSLKEAVGADDLEKSAKRSMCVVIHSVLFDFLRPRGL